MAEYEDGREGEVKANLSTYSPNAQAPVDGLQGTPSPTGNLVVIPITPAEIECWWDRIKASRARREAREKRWETLLRDYIPIVKPSGESQDVRPNKSFRNVHTKIGQVFPRVPDVRLTPKGPATDQVLIPDPMGGPPRPMTPEEAVPIRQSVINSFMGRGAGKINGSRLMDECLFDILAWVGLCCVKVGHKTTYKIWNKPVMQPDPNYQAPLAADILGLAPQAPPPQVPVIDPITGQPKTQPTPIPIHQEWYAQRFSPFKLLLDEELISCRHEEQSRWIAHEAFLDCGVVSREFQIPEDQLTGKTDDDRKFSHEGDESGEKSKKNRIKVIEVWYKSHHFSDELHPLSITQLVLIEGMKERVAVHRRSPDQTFDEMGKLTPDSVIGFPIKVGCLRDIADSPYPDPDTAFISGSTKELGTFRQQSIMLRDAAIGKYFYDVGAIDDDDKKLIKNGPVGAMIALKDGALSRGADKIFYTSAQVKASPDDYKSAAALSADIDETMGISANQAGTPLETVRSATEIAEFSTASAGRSDKEKYRAIDFYLSVVEMVDAYIARYASGDEYTTIVGEDGTRRLAMWNKRIIAGRYAFDVEPDSSLMLDAARSRQQDLAFLNIAITDPRINVIPIWRRVATKFGFDPFKIVATPEQIMMNLQLAGGGGDMGKPANSHVQENSGQKPGAPGSKGDNRTERSPSQPPKPQPGPQGQQ